MLLQVLALDLEHLSNYRSLSSHDFVFVGFVLVVGRVNVWEDLKGQNGET